MASESDPKDAPGTDPDLTLLAKWREGDRDAGGKLLARYFKNLRTYFIQRIPEEDPEDLIQDTFRRMIEARDRFEGRSSFKTYLFNIAKNVYRETLRSKYRHGGAFDPVRESTAEATGRSQSSIVAEAERTQLMLDSLRALPAEQQDLLELFHFYECTINEIAELFEIAVGTAKSRLRAARERLAKIVIERFASDATHSDDSILEDLGKARDAIWRGQLRKLAGDED
ncbi:sigma-70 family RNA polymerase sigma factor [Pseudenhygromyxa sp. WMMC2535]|uniref:RNA polymerase sigma factor n=1 Tax=Pseudenhygromyxa sp. WMMC2535 TaxID=2712867 RepID=UPI001552148B|nr:sigma-70 family RNA polymerase sigma factor [Pseudenhygromyxa sp. WMMC2535]NVB43003.1 sigma-70 family RNA polymerase sigma factor [Pseudenhygromyxa sp. WMMC2535]